MLEPPTNNSEGGKRSNSDPYVKEEFNVKLNKKKDQTKILKCRFSPDYKSIQ